MKKKPMELLAKFWTKLALKCPERYLFKNNFINNIRRVTYGLQFSPCFQMANAPAAISDSIGASTNKMTENDIEAQLAKLRSS